ncbi:hypothetical protein [Actinomadura litoris]|uniref:hypothetical protein n=1 Tax=Actinomadura litoris TaxID=2678616 RepID=UPI001FA7098E|nr:hypothetical protein [Actinomadura litoris]
MSSSLYWRPAPREEPPAHELSYELKKAIAQRAWGHDGSLHGDEITIGPDWVPYLEGLSDAGIDGADELIKAIKDHERVLIWIGG